MQVFVGACGMVWGVWITFSFGPQLEYITCHIYKCAPRIYMHTNISYMEKMSMNTNVNQMKKKYCKCVKRDEIYFVEAAQN